MRTAHALSFLLAVLTASALSTALADEVVLWSGEHLTGRIIDKSADELVLDTGAPVAVRIAWDEIFSLQTDVPQDAMLTSNDTAPRLPMAESSKENTEAEGMV